MENFVFVRDTVEYDGGGGLEVKKAWLIHFRVIQCYVTLSYVQHKDILRNVSVEVNGGQ